VRSVLTAFTGGNVRVGGILNSKRCHLLQRMEAYVESDGLLAAEFFSTTDGEIGEVEGRDINCKSRR
jgi:hypothetical protein